MLFRSTWGDGNIFVDPLFTDPDNGDYSLLASSPCIDTGNPESDLDPDGTIADMGAIYYDQINAPIVWGCSSDPEATNYNPDANAEFTCLYHSGPNWYVAVDGSDSYNDGSEDFPFEIGRADV
mgnify:CR=1 FL=1